MSESETQKLVETYLAAFKPGRRDRHAGLPERGCRARHQRRRARDRQGCLSPVPGDDGPPLPRGAIRHRHHGGRPAGTRAAAEFTVRGTYLATAEGLPEANGQRYTLPAGIFFDIDDDKISRVTTYYNLEAWTKQVAGGRMTPSVRRLERSEAEAAFDDLARLRIEIFRDFPYLYEGDLDYEAALSRDLSDAGRAPSLSVPSTARLWLARRPPRRWRAISTNFAKPFAERGPRHRGLLLFRRIRARESPIAGAGIGGALLRRTRKCSAPRRFLHAASSPP